MDWVLSDVPNGMLANPRAVERLTVLLGLVPRVCC